MVMRDTSYFNLVFLSQALTTVLMVIELNRRACSLSIEKGVKRILFLLSELQQRP
jgi:hypothetical protein